MNKRAAIDIGSNSILLIIAKVNPNGQIEKTLEDRGEIASLGRDLIKTNRFHSESKAATLSILKNYQTVLNSHNIDPKDVLVTATEASRVAEDSQEFFRLIKKDTGFEIQVITPAAEAYFSCLGVISGETGSNNQDGNKMIIDLGGASTEIIWAINQPFKIESFESLPIGAVKYKDLAIENKVESYLATFEGQWETIGKFPPMKATGVGGTIVALAMITQAEQYIGKDRLFEKSEGLILGKTLLNQWYNTHKDKSAEELLGDFPYLGKRAGNIISGLAVLIYVLDKAGLEEIRVSTRGLRHGLIVQGCIDDKFKCP